MEDTLVRIWNHLVGRLTGPLTLRLLLQPTMSTLFAVRDGLRDTRAGRSPFLWTILGSPDDRRRLIREGLIAIGKLAVMAIVLDFVLPADRVPPHLSRRSDRRGVPSRIVPYFVLRGPVNRIASLWVRPGERAADQGSRPRS